MKLFKISQSVNNDYYTYDSAVVAAENEAEAQRTHPGEVMPYTWGEYEWEGKLRTGWFHKHPNGHISHDDGSYSSWAPRRDVTVEYIGEAKAETQAGVICSSFNAG